MLKFSYYSSREKLFFWNDFDRWIKRYIIIFFYNRKFLINSSIFYLIKCFSSWTRFEAIQEKHGR